MAIQLDRPEDEILKEMSSNWRHNLKRFEKKQVKVEQWIDPSPEQLYKYYETFESLKKLGKQHSFSSIKGVIERFKKNLVILRALDEEGNLLALRGYLFIGSRALDWYAISTELGRNCYASYGVLWHILKDAKSKGVTYYDLSGVDPINNAGVYNYKKGTGAKLVEYPGEFEVANFPFISLGMNILMKKKLKAE
jgi:lipid II:glycine glycyltransferase (peptidoglycan interpeptide bridge formation enzyme)